MVSDASPNRHKAEAKDTSPDVPKDLVGTQDDKSGRQGDVLPTSIPRMVRVLGKGDPHSQAAFSLDPKK